MTRASIFVLAFCQFFLLSFFKAQPYTPFCPPAAEWHYEFATFGSPNNYNEMVKYTKDTTMDGFPVKIITHTKFFSQFNTHETNRTFLKQRKDTIWMRNYRTLFEWQILYIYNALPGTPWVNSFLQGAPGTTAKVTYSVEVDSTGSEMLNGFSLKTIYMKYKSVYPTYLSKVYARFGTMGFLFNYPSRAGINGDMYSRFLCYEDYQFPLYKFSGLECDFYTGMEQHDILHAKIFPVPTSNVLNIENFDLNVAEILDLQGNVLLSTGEKTIDLSNFVSGVYLLRANGKNGRQLNKMIVRH